MEESLEVIRTVFCDATNTWAIELKETGEAIGAMGYGPSCNCNLPARDGEPLIGYWIAKPYWNRGICTEALGLMIEHIRCMTDIKSLISGHFVDNPASGRVMEKCGFVPTGETGKISDHGLETFIDILFHSDLEDDRKAALLQDALAYLDGKGYYSFRLHSLNGS